MVLASTADVAPKPRPSPRPPSPRVPRLPGSPRSTPSGSRASAAPTSPPLPQYMNLTFAATGHRLPEREPLYDPPYDHLPSAVFGCFGLELHDGLWTAAGEAGALKVQQVWGAAAGVGLFPNDFITAFNDLPVTDLRPVLRALMDGGAAREVTVTVERGANALGYTLPRAATLDVSAEYPFLSSHQKRCAVCFSNFWVEGPFAPAACPPLASPKGLPPPLSAASTPRLATSPRLVPSRAAPPGNPSHWPHGDPGQRTSSPITSPIRDGRSPRLLMAREGGRPPTSGPPPDYLSGTSSPGPSVHKAKLGTPEHGPRARPGSAAALRDADRLEQARHSHVQRLVQARLQQQEEELRARQLPGWKHSGGLAPLVGPPLHLDAPTTTSGKRSRSAPRPSGHLTAGAMRTGQNEDSRRASGPSGDDTGSEGPPSSAGHPSASPPRVRPARRTRSTGVSCRPGARPDATQTSEAGDGEAPQAKPPGSGRSRSPLWMPRGGPRLSAATAAAAGGAAAPRGTPRRRRAATARDPEVRAGAAEGPVVRQLFAEGDSGASQRGDAATAMAAFHASTQTDRDGLDRGTQTPDRATGGHPRQGSGASFGPGTGDGVQHDAARADGCQPWDSNGVASPDALHLPEGPRSGGYPLAEYTHRHPHEGAGAAGQSGGPPRQPSYVTNPDAYGEHRAAPGTGGAHLQQHSGPTPQRPTGGGLSDAAVPDTAYPSAPHPTAGAGQPSPSAGLYGGGYPLADPTHRPPDHRLGESLQSADVSRHPSYFTSPGAPYGYGEHGAGPLAGGGGPGSLPGTQFVARPGTELDNSLPDNSLGDSLQSADASRQPSYFTSPGAPYGVREPHAGHVGGNGGPGMQPSESQLNSSHPQHRAATNPGPHDGWAGPHDASWADTSHSFLHDISAIHAATVAVHGPSSGPHPESYSMADPTHRPPDHRLGESLQYADASRQPSYFTSPGAPYGYGEHSAGDGGPGTEPGSKPATQLGMQVGSAHSHQQLASSSDPRAGRAGQDDASWGDGYLPLDPHAAATALRLAGGPHPEGHLLTDPTHRPPDHRLGESLQSADASRQPSYFTSPGAPYGNGEHGAGHPGGGPGSLPGTQFGAGERLGTELDGSLLGMHHGSTLFSDKSARDTAWDDHSGANGYRPGDLVATPRGHQPPVGRYSEGDYPAGGHQPQGPQPGEAQRSGTSHRPASEATGAGSAQPHPHGGQRPGSGDPHASAAGSHARVATSADSYAQSHHASRRRDTTSWETEATEEDAEWGEHSSACCCFGPPQSTLERLYHLQRGHYSVLEASPAASASHPALGPADPAYLLPPTSFLSPEHDPVASIGPHSIWLTAVDRPPAPTAYSPSLIFPSDHPWHSPLPPPLGYPAATTTTCATTCYPAPQWLLGSLASPPVTIQAVCLPATLSPSLLDVGQRSFEAIAAPAVPLPGYALPPPLLANSTILSLQPPPSTQRRSASQPLYATTAFDTAARNLLGGPDPSATQQQSGSTAGSNLISTRHGVTATLHSMETANVTAPVPCGRCHCCRKAQRTPRL